MVYKTKSIILISIGLFSILASLSAKYNCIQKQVGGKSRNTIPICYEDRQPPGLNSTVEGLIYPTFLGVGGAKTGSSAFHRLISRHRDVVVGKKNTSTEIGFLVLGKANHTEFKVYASYFPWRSGALAVGEKTPFYSGYAMAPYSARLYLGSKLKLIYTIREPVSATISLYLFRKLYTKKVDFISWASKSLKEIEEVDACKEKKFKAIEFDFSDSQNMRYVDLYNSSLFDWKAVASIEESLEIDCPSLLKYGIDYLSMYRHQENLLRWSFTFAKESVFCVSNDEQLYGETQVLYDNLSKFLHLERNGWVEKEEEQQKIVRSSILERLVESQSDLNVDLISLKRVLVKLYCYYKTRTITSPNIPSITDFCPLYTEREFLELGLTTDC